LLRVPHASDGEDGSGLYDDYIKVNHKTLEKKLLAVFNLMGPFHDLNLMKV
jgi:hypothetical protein